MTVKTSKKALLTAVATAVGLSITAGCGDNSSMTTSGTTTTGGDSAQTGDSSEDSRVKCVPVVDGKNLVAAGKTDCATATHSCAGQNPAGEQDAWIFVSDSVCDDIKKGEFNKVPDSAKDKLDLSSTAKASCSSKDGEKASCSGKSVEKASCSGKGGEKTSCSGKSEAK